jgi:hypothetical protein
VRRVQNDGVVGRPRESHNGQRRVSVEVNPGSNSAVLRGRGDRQADVSLGANSMIRTTIVCSILSLALLLCISRYVNSEKIPSPENDSDLVAQISKRLPKDWSIEISSFEGACFLTITTPVIETEASKRGASNPGIDKTRMGITFKLLPKYSLAMMQRIEAHNKPMKVKLRKLGIKYSPEKNELEQKLIDAPSFYDGNYGFRLCYNSRVPHNPVDAQELIRVLAENTRDWKSYDAEKPDVTAELRRQLTQ